MIQDVVNKVHASKAEGNQLEVHPLVFLSETEIAVRSCPLGIDVTTSLSAN